MLFWSFTDFAYHTSLDRLSHVDPKVLRRMSVAVVATALAVADPAPDDADRYLATLAFDRKLRLGAAREAGHDQTVDRWTTWFGGAEKWLRDLCNEK